jgi:N-acetylglutamate synthase-like GNAT family acetyltransferase
MTFGPSIRLAVAEERTKLEALQFRASLQNARDRDALLANPDAIQLALGQILRSQVFVAEQDCSLAGFAAVQDRDDGQTELDALFVEPTCWRRGIARALLARCAEYGRASGAHSLHVVGNPHSAGFYTSCGFEEHGTQQTRFGIGLLMSKRII